jgi:zinc protease
MLRLFLFAGILSLMAVAVTSASSLFPYKYQEVALENGLRVILIPMKNSGLVSYYTVVDVGSMDEVEAGKSGFAHFFEHIMFRGTDKYPPEVRVQKLTEMGADYNASTNEDFTQYYINFPGKYLETVIDLESDRFMNLKYSLPAFQTEAKAILGEYTKNFSNPIVQLEEKMLDTAFEQSTYKHTTMGFLKDIQNMPNQYEYSLTFFERFYRPENAIIIITGDFNPDQATTLIKKYYSAWKRGNYQPQYPQEPQQQQQKTGKVDYAGDTLPLLALAYKAPTFSPVSEDFAALSILGQLAFGETSPLYKKLVLEQQKVDLLNADNSPHRAPNLFVIIARVKDGKDVPDVQSSILATIEEMKNNPVDAKRLAELKSNFKYGFLMRLDSSKNVASQLPRYIAFMRNMSEIDSLFQTIDKIQPADVQNAAKKYLTENQSTVITLTGAH